MKVGRTALDEEAIRLLEERHPDVSFDWGRILREPPQAISPIESEKRREAREAREARRRKRSRREEQERSAQAPRESGPPGERILDRETDEAVDEEPEVELDEELAADLEADAREGEVETADRDEPEELDSQPPSHPLLDLVGPEGFTRLRARHASLMARIAEVPDEVRREALRLAAEPLNPELWLTRAEARAALETYEANYEMLRAQLGRKRRRRRRRRGGGEKPV